jgi:hypothetical protein
MIDRVKGILFSGAVATAMLLSVGETSAGIIPSLNSVDPENGNFRWTYDVRVTAVQRAEQGAYFTIYDFVGFVPGTAQQPEGWVFSAQPVGITPDRVLPDDSATIMNLTWTRTGGTVGGEGSTVLAGQFSAVSALGQQQLDFFTSSATRSMGFAEGTEIQTIGMVAVPIPLPAAALMFPLGALAAGLVHRRMRKQGC